jgi:hypothetical protein
MPSESVVLVVLLHPRRRRPSRPPSPSSSASSSSSFSPLSSESSFSSWSSFASSAGSSFGDETVVAGTCGRARAPTLSERHHADPPFPLPGPSHFDETRTAQTGLEPSARAAHLPAKVRVIARAHPARQPARGTGRSREELPMLRRSSLRTRGVRRRPWMSRSSEPETLGAGSRER